MSLLHKRTILVALNIGHWPGTTGDDDANGVVAKHYGSDKSFGKAGKYLINPAAIKPIVTAKGTLRTWFYKNTLPYPGVNGWRVLPTKNYMDFVQEFSRLKDDFDRANENVESNYIDLVEEAKQKLNGRFKLSEYPTARNLKARRYCKLNFQPIPSGEEFQDVEFLQDAVQELKEDTETRLAEAQVRVMKELWQRLYDVVKRVYDNLKERDKGYRDTMIGNVIELVNLLPKLNFTDDQDLERMRRQVEKDIASLDKDDLTDDEEYKKEALKKTEDIMAKMKDFMSNY